MIALDGSEVCGQLAPSCSQHAGRTTYHKDDISKACSQKRPTANRTERREILRAADLQHFQAALRTPRSGNRVNEIAAHAPHFQCTGEWVGFTFLTVLRRLIFKDHNHVHGTVPVEPKAIVATLRGGQSAGLSGYATSEGDYRLSICNQIVAPYWGTASPFFPEIFFKFFFRS